jgi:replicative DNA helicase
MNLIGGFMPRDGYKKINIFIAAPSDVAIEKERVISIVEQLNNGLADSFGIVLEVKEWSQVVPNMGRGQKVIFDQLPFEQWDIMIGILWLRYGMPSGGSNRERSGTHEEFNIAYEYWQKTGKPRIMFYRCIRPPEDVIKIDIDSLTKINNFFKQFETEGKNQGLYYNYNTINDFEAFVRNHLEKILIEYSDKERGETRFTADEQPQKDPQPIVSVLSDYYEQIDNFASHSDTTYGVPTGFIDLDRLTNGLKPSNLLVVASRASQHKTSFLLSILRNAALTYKKHITLSLPLGMSNNEIVQHLIAQETGIDPYRLSVGKLTEHEWPLFVHAIEVMSETHIFLDDSAALTFRRIKEKSHQLVSESQIDLIIVDNLHFIRNEENNVSPVKDLNYINLKILAHELNVPVLAGVQLTRNSERRLDKRPQLSDLHEFGQLEDLADVIMFIHHPDPYEVDFAAANVAEVIVAKHNYGPVGTINLLFRSNLSKYENAATRILK